MNRKEHYNKKGMYAGYDKNHKERQAEDYYSTPTEEVENILNLMDLDFDNCTILEPCAGGGHMAKGIWNHLNNNHIPAALINTDIKERENQFPEINIATGPQFDFLSDEYPIVDNIDYIIMNPPFSVIEPFVMKALGVANKGVLMFGRLQFLEGEKRYINILKDYPPSEVYVYVDRIKCYKNGDPSITIGAIQAYAWYYWDINKLENNEVETKVYWIRRVDKK